MALSRCVPITGFFFFFLYLDKNWAEVESTSPMTQFPTQCWFCGWSEKTRFHDWNNSIFRYHLMDLLQNLTLSPSLRNCLFRPPCWEKEDKIMPKMKLFSMRKSPFPNGSRRDIKKVAGNQLAFMQQRSPKRDRLHNDMKIKRGSQLRHEAKGERMHVCLHWDKENEAATGGQAIKFSREKIQAFKRTFGRNASSRVFP